MGHPLRLIQKLLSPPVFPADDDKTRVAAILNLVLWILMGLVLLSEPVIFFGSSTLAQTWLVYLSAILAPCLLGSVLYLLHKGYVAFAAWAFVLLQWLSANAQVLASGGINSPALSAFIVSILIAGFLINNRVALLFTGLSLASLALVIVADTYHLIPPATLFDTASGKFRILASTLVVTAAMLSLILQSLKVALQKTRAYARELEAERAALKRTIQELTEAQANIRQLNETLEGRVSERTRQLENANKELEAFSYSVSHDLRAPLRAMLGYAQVLKEDYTPVLDPPGQNFLQKIIAAGKRMNLLIDDLLSFSRLGHKPMALQEVNLNELVTTVIDTLALETADRHIEWTLTAMPPATADPILLQQVYANLIGNAVKYTSKREAARIEVGSVQQQGECIYFVRDNGAGFDMAYAHKLFGVFQRLHSNSEFEGTGIGLATVQRILHHHGGRIWAEAEPHHGATFYFTLPE